MRCAIGSGETDHGDPGFSSAAGLGCAIIAAFEVLGDPCSMWSMLVLRALIFGRSSAGGVFGDTSFAAV